MNYAMRSFAAACLAVAAGLTAPAQAQQKVLKFIPQADLRILDPIATTAYITRNHGYMVYDTLFAIDSKFQVKPQMVDKYELSKDKLTYTFTLRRAQVPRRSPGPVGRLHRFGRALGQARRTRAEARRVDRILDRRQRQDIQTQAEEAVCAH